MQNDCYWCFFGYFFGAEIILLPNEMLIVLFIDLAAENVVK